MREHLVTGDIGRIARDVKAARLYPVGHVIILATPAPEDVAEAVHQSKVVGRHRRDAAEEVAVR